MERGRIENTKVTLLVGFMGVRLDPNGEGKPNHTRASDRRNWTNTRLE